MIKKFSVLILILILCLSFISCSKEEIRETSVAGAYYLMFQEMTNNGADISAYTYLSFDKESTGLEGEDLEILENLIKDYCDEIDIGYLDMDKTRLRRALKIDDSARGEVFTGGYLLSYSNCRFEEDEDGEEFFTGDIELWHGDFDAKGGLDFIIKKTNKGWYIDRDQTNGGYDTIIS